MQCGKPIEQNWVACPFCGKKYEQATPVVPQRQQSTVNAWYPSKRQWWIMWVTLVLAYFALMLSANDPSVGGPITGVFIIPAGALLVWKFSHQKSS
jgi:hypothetical protein